MHIKHKYSRIERTLYEFEEHEIIEALMRRANISYRPVSEQYKLEMDCDDNSATLTVIYEDGEGVDDDDDDDDEEGTP